MVFLLTGTSAAQLPPHGLFVTHGRRWAAGIPLMSGACGAGVCVQARREVLYMRRRFHGNVVRQSCGVYLMELRGVTERFASVCGRVGVYALNSGGAMQSEKNKRFAVELCRNHSGFSLQYNIIWFKGIFFFAHLGTLTSFSVSSSSTAADKGSASPFSPFSSAVHS